MVFLILAPRALPAQLTLRPPLGTALALEQRLRP